MKSPFLMSNPGKVLPAALLVFLSGNVAPAWAQKAAPTVRPVITIDGSVEPDRIPDWILWRELFRVAALMADQQADSGRNIWMSRLGLTAEQMNQVVAHGRAFLNEEKQIDRDVKRIAGPSGQALSDQIKSKLNQIEADKQSRILARRDALRSRIGTDTYLRMQSFARLHIAPTIKLGSFVAAKK